MSEMAMRVECEKKPRKCPECGKAPLASILYGEPAYSKELERKIDEGRISLGGCCVTYDNPVWECTHCGLKIYQRKFNDFPI